MTKSAKSKQGTHGNSDHRFAVDRPRAENELVSTNAVAVGAKGPSPGLKVLSTGRNAGFRELVLQIEKTYGVKVANEPKSVKNPYKMSKDDALAVARRAGLVTKGGKLAGTFK